MSIYQHIRIMMPLAIVATLLSGCNKSDDNGPTPEPSTVTSLDLTVTGSNSEGPAVQAPAGNAYLFYSEDVDLNYATGEGDGSTVPLVDVSTDYNLVVRYRKNGETRTLHPVSAYGTMSGGNLDNHTSVRYSQIHFDLTRLDTTYGTVGKGSLVLVVIVLNDAQSKSWTVHPLQLRRDYLIHISLPDNLKRTYVDASQQSAKWWQVEGDE